jgi:hypothetical protein
MIGRYWWSNQDKDNKIHWISWERLTRPKGEGGLGFRDIHLFNMAMLAKQGWRLVHNTESLCARVLRAKYYPEGNVLKARPAPNMSYTWRSILKGIEVLKAGMIWRVGDGSSINIWQDPWLPRECTRMPITPRGNSLLTKVSELIDPVTGRWDDQLVLQTFVPQDAELILATPVHTELEDLVAWHFDPRGSFSVRSAYKAYRGHVKRNERGGGASTTDSGLLDRKQWKAIWSLKCPGKVKQFLWRFTHNTLAVRRNLERRGVKMESVCCVMCRRSLEDGGHLFFQCKYVKMLWRELYMEDQRSLMAAKPSAREVMLHILQLEERLQLKVVLLLWRWWSERNGVREGERRRTAADLAYVVHTNTEEFLELHESAGRPHNSQKQWHKPPGEWLKINTDGAFSASTGEGGWGFVIRDEHGAVMAAGAGGLTQVRDAFQAEIHACMQGVMAAANKGMDKVILETDSLMLKQALESEAYRLAEMGGYIFQLKSLIHGSFSRYRCNFVPRSCNRVAHTLAAEGSLCNHGGDVSWDFTPPCVSDSVASDAASSLS